jgi:hypothetical protein
VNIGENFPILYIVYGYGPKRYDGYNRFSLEGAESPNQNGYTESQRIKGSAKMRAGHMVVLKDIVAISNGSACTSQNYTASHVLMAMGLPEDQIKGALRFSWCHLTPKVNWNAVVSAIKTMRV